MRLQLKLNFLQSQRQDRLIQSIRYCSETSFASPPCRAHKVGESKDLHQVDDFRLLSPPCDLEKVFYAWAGEIEKIDLKWPL